ncbi:MAG: hypothetical protein SFV23_17585 [Planctomycetaceae bacterium]|nr:hypothetical protein [Planctomycetaceae bacterium]
MKIHAEANSPASTPTRCGAPAGNRNARKHGLRGRKLSREERYIANSTTAFQRETESAVIERFGEVDLYRAAVIQSAVRHETRAQLIGRWLRVAEEQGEKLTLIDRANLLKQLSDASDARDKCLERIGLDKPVSAHGPAPWEHNALAVMQGAGGEPKTTKDTSQAGDVP